MGNFLELQNIGDKIGNQFVIIDILPSTGLQIKYDPTISLIYFGFGILMITGCLSFLPYTQIWMCQQSLYCRLAGSTNRGKIQLEIEFENLLREIETKYKKVSFVKKLIEN
eukprot:gene12583-13773_t